MDFAQLQKKLNSKIGGGRKRKPSNKNNNKGDKGSKSSDVSVWNAFVEKQNAKLGGRSSTVYKPQFAVLGGGNVDMLDKHMKDKAATDERAYKQTHTTKVNKLLEDMMASVEGGTSPMLGGKMPVLGGKAPVLGGKAPVLGGKAPVLGGKTAVLGGKAPVLGGKAKKPQSEKMKKRRDLVRKIMTEKNMSLPQASSYIKKNNLKY